MPRRDSFSLRIESSKRLIFLSDGHYCWYSVKETNKTSGMDYTEQCHNDENMCVVVSKEDEGYEYR